MYRSHWSWGIHGVNINWPAGFKVCPKCIIIVLAMKHGYQACKCKAAGYTILFWYHFTQSIYWRNISSAIDEDVLSLFTLCVGSGAVWCK